MTPGYKILRGTHWIREMVKTTELKKLIGDWLVPEYDPTSQEHREKVRKTVNAICLELNITPKVVDGLYSSRRHPYVNEATDILTAFLEAANE